MTTRRRGAPQPHPVADPAAVAALSALMFEYLGHKRCEQRKADPTGGSIGGIGGTGGPFSTAAADRRSCSIATAANSSTVREADDDR